MTVTPPEGFTLDSVAQSQPSDMTAMSEKTAKSKSGKTYNVGDHIPGHGTIKGFSKDASGNIHANF